MGFLLVAGFGFALSQFAVGKARKPIVYFRIYCPTCLTSRTRPTLLLPTSAKHHLCFLPKRRTELRSDLKRDIIP